uniref:Transcription repressor n=1 Tax=Aegilops tauschii subsp. strangulata TaxID=200361 RepID=A0A453I530_AEGTS
ASLLLVPQAQGEEHKEGQAIARVSAESDPDQKTSQQGRPPARPPAACAGYSPNRASYYFPSADRAPRPDGALRCIAPRGAADDDGAALDVRVDVIHRRAGRLGGIDAPPATPELNLRRIVTRPAAKNDPAESAAVSSSASTPTSAATTPSTCRAWGFHVKPDGRRRRQRGHDDKSTRKEKAAEDAGSRRRRWLYESLVVVKTSSDPERDMAESMAEMVAANHIGSSEDLEELLACYLALNAAEHHRAVLAAFRRVWHSGFTSPAKECGTCAI